ncbi:MAG: histidine kinase dimerization/phospho-acceptor domain-containing protein, partial [Verrucomicrobiota bacterium]
MTIRAKTWLALALAGLAPLLLFSWFAFAVAYRGLTSRIDSQLIQQAAAERQTVTGFVSRNRERLRLVTSRTQLRLSLAAQLESPAPEHVARIERILNDARNSIGSFRVLSVANEDGEIVASTNSAFRGQSLAEDPLFQHALEVNDACEFALNEGVLTKRLIGPMRLGGRRLGLAIIDLDASRLLDLTGDVNRLGNSARVYLSQKGVDGEVRHLNGDASRIVDEDGNPLIDRAFGGSSLLFGEATEVNLDGNIPAIAATSYAADSRVAVIVKVRREEALAPARQLLQGAIFTALIAIACLVSAGVLLSRSITEPVRSLAVAAAKMAKGDFKARALKRTAGEVETLRTEFNEMADHIAASARELESRVAERTAELRAAQLQLIQAEKLESMGRLSAGVAHEIKNPLNTLQACVDFYKLKGPDDDDEVFTIETMEESIQRATRIVRGMLDFSRDEQLKMETTSINAVILEALDLVQPDVVRAKVEFVHDLGTDLPQVVLDP